eukprot:Platyproteum_vivax@DN4402_c0_g1_i2.p1
MIKRQNVPFAPSFTVFGRKGMFLTKPIVPTFVRDERNQLIPKAFAGLSFIFMPRLVDSKRYNKAQRVNVMVRMEQLNYLLGQNLDEDFTMTSYNSESKKLDTIYFKTHGNEQVQEDPADTTANAKQNMSVEVQGVEDKIVVSCSKGDLIALRELVKFMLPTFYGWNLYNHSDLLIDSDTTTQQ